MVESKKKYWLKLNKDFLKSPQIKVIKGMPNGKDYIIFYLALMLESIETVGHLRFTSLVPYNAEMLASVTDTNVDIVRSATKVFCELDLMRIFEDGTIFMPQVPEMTGKECDSAERVRLFRERQKLLQCNKSVTSCNDNIYIDKDKDKDKEIKKEIDIYVNKYKSFFEKKYKETFGNSPFLSPIDCKKIVELSVEYDSSIISKAIEKLKEISFDSIDFKPSASWLLKDNNFERVMNGEFDKQKKSTEFKY